MHEVKPNDPTHSIVSATVRILCEQEETRIKKNLPIHSRIALHHAAWVNENHGKITIEKTITCLKYFPLSVISH